MVQHLPNKLKVLSSTPTQQRERERERRKEAHQFFSPQIYLKNRNFYGHSSSKNTADC
jgi:hypothetical protein